MTDWKTNPPSTFFDDNDVPYDPATIAENFGLDASKYSMYFEAYDDWKKDFAEDEFGLAGSEAAALLGGDDPRTEEIETGDGLLKTNYDARSGRLDQKGDEASSSLSLGIGSTMSNLTNKYADAVSQSVGQQVSFTSGASGRQKAKAFDMTQEAMGSAAAEQNLKFTTTSRDLAEASDLLDASYEYDVGAAERDLDTAEFKKDYKTASGKKEWDDSIYNSLRQLGNKGAWDEEEKEEEEGGCCFIVLEVEEKNVLNKDVRKYRDEMMNDCNRAGYYKLAQVVVPLMRKSKLMKLFFKYLFVNPAKSWAKWHYHGKGIGWVFEPLRRSWLGLFSYLGLKHKMKSVDE